MERTGTAGSVVDPCRLGLDQAVLPGGQADAKGALTRTLQEGVVVVLARLW